MNKPIGEVITMATMECAKAAEGIFNKYNLPASIAVMIVEKIKSDLVESKTQEIMIMHDKEVDKMKKEYELQIEKLKAEQKNEAEVKKEEIV